LAKDNDEDSIVSRSRAALADSGQKLPPLDEMTGRPKMGPIDVSEMRDDLRVTPRFASINKDSQYLSGMVSGTKKLDKNTALQGHLGVDLSNDKYNGPRARGTNAGINLLHSFAKGGKVTASTRADGIAQRGRTKGRVI
jgi:hypothetical protein